MSLDQRFGIGETFQLGSHTFHPEEIIAFARKFDPQPFHLSEEAARNSVFGKLCASGWHTASMWARFNAAGLAVAVERSKRFGEPIEIGPAAGLKNLKWLKPVYAGDAIAFTRMPQTHRTLASRPGWHMLNSLCEAVKEGGEVAMRFEAEVLVKA